MMNIETGPCWLIVRNKDIITHGYMSSGQETASIYTIDTFDSEDEYRNRYHQLTGEYPPVEEDE